jgi:predicted deacetylase
MIPRPAQYLLRFDDLCPTMSRARWERFEALIEECGVRPILAVVPDNRDPELMVSDPDPMFWNRMRTLETKGATIAMHGYQHLCNSSGKSLVALHRESEFAGADEDVQRHWIRKGLEILRGQGLNPRLFVAPRHGFDRATLRALNEEGLGFLSDGFARLSATRDEVVLIPQQLWKPLSRSKGLWTICIHSNTEPDTAVEKLRKFLHEHRAQLTSFDQVVVEYRDTKLDWIERLYAAAAVLRIRVSGMSRRWSS